ncbi:hypothetical protein F4802DRAFT_566908 [Xylaria palmicola]|nr:hypothetical protein F4802DRAFT_566908 [Xylaria palmicola]
MAELGRIAQAAVRSAPLLRAAPMRSQSCRSLVLAYCISDRSHMSTTSALRALGDARQQQPSFWARPCARKDGNNSIDESADIKIQKPNSAAYNMAYGVQTEGGKDNQELPDFHLDVADFRKGREAKNEIPIAPRAYLRMVPRTGRTVHVRGNVDVAKSFKAIGAQVFQNRVRTELRLQKFHERPGKKRKRLTSERWRRRFAKGFKATLSRVRELTAQGW